MWLTNRKRFPKGYKQTFRDIGRPAAFGACFMGEKKYVQENLIREAIVCYETKLWGGVSNTGKMWWADEQARPRRMGPEDIDLGSKLELPKE